MVSCHSWDTQCHKLSRLGQLMVVSTVPDRHPATCAAKGFRGTGAQRQPCDKDGAFHSELGSFRSHPAVRQCKASSHHATQPGAQQWHRPARRTYSLKHCALSILPGANSKPDLQGAQPGARWRHRRLLHRVSRQFCAGLVDLQACGGSEFFKHCSRYHNPENAWQRS